MIRENLATGEIGNQKDIPAVVNALPIYTVEGLLRKAGIFTQTKVFAKIESIIRVKGIATKIKTYSNCTYMVLVDRDFSISVKYGPKKNVQENQPVIVEGVLFIKPTTLFTGLECYIDGDIVGSWQQSEEISQPSRPTLVKNRYYRLDDFFAKQSISELLVAGTDTAIVDVCSQLDSAWSPLIKTRTLRVGKKEALLNDLGSLKLTNIKAIALTRGGDDQTLKIWDDADVVAKLLEFDIPFYVALGHSHALTLTDRYADGTFHTPSSLGTAINACIVQRRNINLLLEEQERIKKDNLQLTLQIKEQEQIKEDNFQLSLQINTLKKQTLSPQKMRFFVFLIALTALTFYLLGKY